MKKNTSWKFTDESSVTFQSSVSGPGEFSLYQKLFGKNQMFWTELTFNVQNMHWSSSMMLLKLYIFPCTVLLQVFFSFFMSLAESSHVIIDQNKC